MVNQVSFIHAADLHLDSPFKGLSRVPEGIFKEIQESTFVALDRLVEVAIAKQVDFVLLVGDLFDNEKQSLKAQIRLRDAFSKLNHHHIHVYLSYGNHDFITGNNYPIKYPDNVHIFNDEKVSHYTYEREGQSLASIYGFSYENRAVHENKANEFSISDKGVPFHIAMLHGSFNSNSDHDVYSPFRLSDLTEKDFDYWALGHIHKRTQLSENPPVIYPGNTQGRNRKESGEKGCYHVVISDSRTATSFIPLHSILFKNVMLDISTCEYPHQIEEILRKAIGQHETESRLLSLTITTVNPEHRQWETEGLITDLLELANETSIHPTNWDYIYRYSLEISSAVTDDELTEGQHFIGELVRHANEITVKPYVEELYHHKQARKYLQPVTEAEEKAIKKEAQQFLVYELLKGEDE